MEAFTSHRPARLIGQTPLIELTKIDRPNDVRIFGKIEGQNPTGSIKDRVALRLVLDAEARGEIRPGMTLVEASTGNTAIALSMVGKQRGYHVRIVLPHGVVPSVPMVLETLGTEVVWCPPESGTLGAIKLAEQMARDEPDVYAVQQFSRPANIDVHYETTGTEIAEALPHVDALVAGIGTGGTIMGVGRRLRDAYDGVKVYGLEPQLGEYLQGLRRIDDVFAAPLLDLNELDGRFIVTAADSINAAKQVAEREGLLVGVSAGAALHIAWRVADRLPSGAVIVCMFSDSGWKYLPATPWQAAEAQAVELDEVHWW